MGGKMYKGKYNMRITADDAWEWKTVIAAQ